MYQIILQSEIPNDTAAVCLFRYVVKPAAHIEHDSLIKFHTLVTDKRFAQHLLDMHLTIMKAWLLCMLLDCHPCTTHGMMVQGVQSGLTKQVSKVQSELEQAVKHKQAANKLLDANRKKALVCTAALLNMTRANQSVPLTLQ